MSSRVPVAIRFIALMQVALSSEVLKTALI